MTNFVSISIKSHVFSFLQYIAPCFSPLLIVGFFRLCSFPLLHYITYHFAYLSQRSCSQVSTDTVLFNLQSEVFAVAFALLAAGAVILTLNVLLLVILSLSLPLPLMLALNLVWVPFSFLLDIKILGI